jgi:hypothetical protein
LDEVEVQAPSELAFGKSNVAKKVIFTLDQFPSSFSHLALCALNSAAAFTLWQP